MSPVSVILDTDKRRRRNALTIWEWDLPVGFSHRDVAGEVRTRLRELRHELQIGRRKLVWLFGLPGIAALRDIELGRRFLTNDNVDRYILYVNRRWPTGTGLQPIDLFGPRCPETIVPMGCHEADRCSLIPGHAGPHRSYSAERPMTLWKNDGSVRPGALTREEWSQRLEELVVAAALERSKDLKPEPDIRLRKPRKPRRRKRRGTWLSEAEWRSNRWMSEPQR